MACEKCFKRNCSGSCSSKGVISRDNSFTNSSEGRDGEDAYEAYVRKGGELSWEEWVELSTSNVYNEDNWD